MFSRSSLLMQIPQFSLHTADFIVLILYFSIVFALGWWVYKRTRTGDDLFLAGRTLTWSVIGFSLFASNISSSTLIGLTGSAYETGIVVSNYEWMAAFILILMCFTTIPVFLRTRIRTIPEFLERRFDRRCRLYFSALNLFLIIVVDTAGGLYAGAIVLRLFFPGMEIWELCMIIAVLAGLYTAGGGLRAVAYTDVMQAIVLIAGSSIILISVLNQIDWEWSASLAQLPEQHLSLIRPLDDETLPWTGTLLGVPILGFYFWSTNQFIAQRILGAKNITHARWGAIFAGFLKLIPLYIMILPGAFALLLYPDLQDGDLVFPTLIVDLLPAGLVGLVLAGLIAAVMSSVDSSLNSASTLLTLDFIERKGHQLSPSRTARLGRYLTFGFMLLAALWAPLIQFFPGLWAYLQSVLGYSIPPVAAIFLAGVLSRRVTAGGAFWALAGTHACAVVVVALTASGVITWHFTLAAFALFIVALAILAAFALTRPVAVSPEQDACIIRPEDLRPEHKVALWKDFRVQALMLVLLTSAMILSFW